MILLVMPCRFSPPWIIWASRRVTCAWPDRVFATTNPNDVSFVRSTHVWVLRTFGNCCSGRSVMSRLEFVPRGSMSHPGCRFLLTPS
ncbi:hypothetical protein BDW60DRAFT_195964 [Aspergillus nidulans var. acristatus]